MRRYSWLLLAITLFTVTGTGLAFAAGTPVNTLVTVTNLQPSWTATGGAGVYAGYYGPNGADAVSPGTTAFFLGRQAAIIKAGQGTIPAAGAWDEGLLGFKPECSVADLVSSKLTYEVANEHGTNPVWMTIEVGDPISRTNNVSYQSVPTTNPAGFHTVDAGAGVWQKMDADGNATGPQMTLAEIATAAPEPKQAVRVYLRLGMGDSYYAVPDGTVGWVDNIVVGTKTYDFAVATSTVTASAGAHGSVTPTTQPVFLGQDATVTVTPDAGYHIASVTVDGDAKALGDVTFKNVTADHIVSATFAINTYTLKASAGAHGAISSPGTTTVDFGADATYTITPDAGYHVASVTVDGDAKALGNVVFKNVSADHTVAATFALNTYTIVPAAGVHGAISSATTQTVAYGADATFTITPASGYKVSAVLVDGVAVGAVSSYTFHNVTAAHTISATFVTVQVSTKLTMNVNPTVAKTGHSVHFFGVTSPNMANHTAIAFMVRKAGSTKWTRAVPYARTFDGHHWSYSYHPATRGIYYFKAVLSATSTYAGVTSRTVKVTWK